MLIAPAGEFTGRSFYFQTEKLKIKETILNIHSLTSIIIKLLNRSKLRIVSPKSMETILMLVIGSMGEAHVKVRKRHFDIIELLFCFVKMLHPEGLFWVLNIKKS